MADGTLRWDRGHGFEIARQATSACCRATREPARRTPPRWCGHETRSSPPAISGRWPRRSRPRRQRRRARISPRYLTPTSCAVSIGSTVRRLTSQPRPPTRHRRCATVGTATNRSHRTGGQTRPGDHRATPALMAIEQPTLDRPIITPAVRAERTTRPQLQRNKRHLPKGKPPENPMCRERECTSPVEPHRDRRWPPLGSDRVRTLQGTRDTGTAGGRLTLHLFESLHGGVGGERPGTRVVPGGGGRPVGVRRRSRWWCGPRCLGRARRRPVGGSRVPVRRCDQHT